MTGVEVAKVVELLRELEATLVNVGHGRDVGSDERAARFVRAWSAVGGEIGAVVSWPASAASWLKPACRLVSGAPDAWVVADEPTGWTGFCRRLAAVGGWRPDRTVAFSGLTDPLLPAAVGAGATEGMRGAASDGTGWMFADGRLITEVPEQGR
ncbi:hypothetical protein [Saccharopolyspora erythraea]|uniref:hypothetical protein n=1 Tax=Saccharopolyspora erythraea TaxID=1836 RepID=UPI0020111EF5|nr:hypothetical protein [Saccharopolyspora erythraea]